MVDKKISDITTTETLRANLAYLEGERGDGTGVKVPPSILDGDNPHMRFPAMPALAGFTNLNVSGTRYASETAGKAIIVGDTSTTGGVQIHGVYKAHGLSTPYRIAIPMRSLGQKVNYLFPCVGWRQSSDGKIMTFNTLLNTSAWEVHNWSSPTSRVSTSGATMASNLPDADWPRYGLGFLGLRDDGTTLYFEYSPDGNKDTFMTIASVLKASAYITTPDQVFLGMYQETATGRNFRAIFRALDLDGLTRTY